MTATDYLDLLGERVTWTDGMGQVHAARVVAYSNSPTYLLDLDDGRRLIASAHAVKTEEER